MRILPEGWRVSLDSSVRVADRGALLLGGSPWRVLRLSAAGRSALASLRGDVDLDEPARRLGARLVAAEMAHPRVPAAHDSAGVVVVIPVHDRVEELARCLAATAGDRVLVVDDGSSRSAEIAAVCARYGARIIRCPQQRGPGAARNVALCSVDADVVAFLDSDCIPRAGWTRALMPLFADPAVGAVAPRVRPVASRRAGSVLTRYVAARFPLDMGAADGVVGPGQSVRYVPTAALLVRRSAAMSLGAAFDEDMHVGEDVDFVWRLCDAGWRVRYVAEPLVEHENPAGWRALLRRRFAYGTSAADLAIRHPGRVPSCLVPPWSGPAAMLLLGGRVVSGALAVVLRGLLLSRKISSIGAATPIGLLISARNTWAAVCGMSRAACGLGGPLLIWSAVRGSGRHRRRLALGLLLAHPAETWWRSRPALDPLRWLVACVCDEMAYGAGVLWGCVRRRTIDPLIPRRGVRA